MTIRKEYFQVGMQPVLAMASDDRRSKANPLGLRHVFMASVETKALEQNDALIANIDERSRRSEKHFEDFCRFHGIDCDVDIAPIALTPPMSDAAGTTRRHTLYDLVKRAANAANVLALIPRG